MLTELIVREKGDDSVAQIERGLKDLTIPVCGLCSNAETKFERARNGQRASCLIIYTLCTEIQIQFETYNVLEDEIIQY